MRKLSLENRQEVAEFLFNQRNTVVERLHRHHRTLPLSLIEEAAEDAVIRILSLKDTSRKFSEDELRRYYHHVARNLVVDALRDFREMEVYSDLSEDSSGPATTPSELLEDREELTILRKIIDQLPSNEKQLLLLRYFEGLTYQDIALRLGVSSSAVKSRAHRALRRLRELLTEAQQDRGGRNE